MLDSKQLVHEIQEMRDDGHLSDALLRFTVKHIEKADHRFDWVGVYLVAKDETHLWLHNYVGSATEHSKIPIGSGVCGIAVAQKTNQNVADVSEFEGYIACNPDTQSELVILIRAGDDIFGQIDLDSNEKGTFTDEDAASIGAVADKLAEQLAAERR